jgi:hypothetical protein
MKAFAVKLSNSKYYTVYTGTLEDCAAETKRYMAKGAKLRWFGVCEVIGRMSDHPKTTRPVGNPYYQKKFMKLLADGPTAAEPKYVIVKQTKE